jgi:uncharacterized protein (TIGR02284 family)
MINNIPQFVKRISYLALSFAFLACYPGPSLAGQSSTQEQKNVEETAKTLQSLIQYEIDGSFLVAQCMENVNNQALKDKLIKIKEECEENIKDLSDLVRKYGREVPTHSRDFKGFFMQGYAAMRGALTDQGAMKALHTNSQMILKAFESALNTSLPADVKDVIRKVYDKKKKTHQYIESQI